MARPYLGHQLEGCNQEKISQDLTSSDGGFTRSVGCGQFYFHKDKD